MTSNNPRETVRRLVIIVNPIIWGVYAAIFDRPPLVSVTLSLYVFVGVGLWALNPWVKAGER